jgi:hypothetical protein
LPFFIKKQQLPLPGYFVGLNLLITHYLSHSSLLFMQPQVEALVQKLLIRSLVLFYFLFFFSRLCAQAPETVLQKFAENYPQEKLVLLLFKATYLSDTIQKK